MVHNVYNFGRSTSLAAVLFAVGSLSSAYGQRIAMRAPASQVPESAATGRPAPMQPGLAELLALPPPPLAIIEGRIPEVVRHQNAMRLERGLPPLSAESVDITPHSASPNLLAIRVKTDPAPKSETMSLLGAGDALIKGVWGDVESTNYVYWFDGAVLQKAQPFAEFALERLAPAPEVYLVRNMSAKESRHWRDKDLDALKARRRDWGYGKGVAHFELGRRSWIGSHRPVAGAWRIPKDVLLEWLRVGELSMGITSISRAAESAALNIETVIGEGVWRQLADYRVEDDATKVSPWKKALSWLLCAAVSGRSRTQAR